MGTNFNDWAREQDKKQTPAQAELSRRFRESIKERLAQGEQVMSKTVADVIQALHQFDGNLVVINVDGGELDSITQDTDPDTGETNVVMDFFED